MVCSYVRATMERNIPNALTLSRVIVAPVVCALIFLGTPFGNWAALAAYLYACATDFLDGYLARSCQQQSDFGRMLDPIADKLLVASILLTLVGVGRVQDINLIPALVILWREILVSGLREYLAELRVSVPVTTMAKWKTALQLVAIGFLIVGDVLPSVWTVDATTIGIVGLWLAATLTIATGYDYLRASLVHLSRSPDSRQHRGIGKTDPARDSGC